VHFHRSAIPPDRQHRLREVIGPKDHGDVIPADLPILVTQPEKILSFENDLPQMTSAG
jgi:hypothetical protein